MDDYTSGAHVPPGTPRTTSPQRARAEVDLDAISANAAQLRRHVGGRDLMAVVKANGYGHGAVEVARAAREGGATWLGVPYVDEALHLRGSGDDGPILAWLSVPGEPLDALVTADIDLGVSTLERLSAVAEAAQRSDVRAHVHLKIDTGMARSGATMAEVPALVQEAALLRDRGLIDVRGVMSHLARADEVGHPSTGEQIATFEEAVGLVLEAGLEPQHLHLANSPATLSRPDAWFTMIRPGLSLYGLDPFGGEYDHGVPLRPAMRLSAPVAQTKRVSAGQPVSYSGTYVTSRETTLAIVPLGYADGIPRQASDAGAVLIGDETYRVAGRVCMDQFVVDVGDAPVRAGDEAVVWGDPDRGEPSAQVWADAAGTIAYDIVTRLGGRLALTYPRAGVL